MAKVGRPSKYKADTCERLLEFFSRPCFEIVATTFGTKEVPNPTPYVIDFCMDMDISEETFFRWISEKPEFCESYKKAKKLQERFVIENALRGNHKQVPAIFFLKNCHGWVDKTESESTVTYKKMDMIEDKSGNILEFDIGKPSKALSRTGSITRQAKITLN